MNLDTIPINQTLPAISCDYDSLRSWALGVTAKYKDLTITADQVKEIKSDMADLNKAKQKLDRARIDTVKAVSAPIREFEVKIKEITTLFDEAYKSLADQVKAFEAAEKEEKGRQIQAMIAVECQQASVDSDRVQVDPKWLNKSVSMAAIRNEIRAIIHDLKDSSKQPVMPPLEGFLVNPDKCIAQAQINQNEANPAPEDIAQESRDHMEAKIAEKSSANPLIVWRMYFRYSPDQQEQVRQIFQECQFMRIVRRLDAIGIKAEIFRDEV